MNPPLSPKPKTNINMLTDRQLIDQLYKVIDDQERKLAQFQSLLRSHIENMRELQYKYLEEKKFTQETLNKLDSIKKQNNELQVEIRMVKSDNLIMKSQLNFQDIQLSFQKEHEQNKWINDNKQNEQFQKNKHYQLKIGNIKTVIKRLLKAIQKLITTQCQDQNLVITEVAQIAHYLKDI